MSIKSKTLRVFTLTGKEREKPLVPQLHQETREELTRVMGLTAIRERHRAER